MPNERFRSVVLALVTLLSASTTARAAEAAKDTRCDPKVWQSAIREFEAQDAKNPPPKGGIVFVGSSTIRLWNLAESFPGAPAINRGFGGSQICHSTHFAETLVVKLQPRLIVLYAGDNDIKAGKTAEQVHRDFRQFVAVIRKSLPKTPIVFISIKPSVNRWHLRETMQAANRLIEADCKKDTTLRFLDVWPAMLGEDGQPRVDLLRDDGLHLNAAGYKLWSERLAPLLEGEARIKAAASP
jgi:hypothetical protein